MHTNEIICCDWGLDVAAAESNLQFLGGEKKARVCEVFPKPSFIHSWPQIPPSLSRKRSIYFAHKHQNQVFRMTMYLRVIEYDMKIAMCGEKFCLS